MNRIKASKKIALTFFILGSILFLTQLFLQQLNYITIIGYYYLGLSIVINIILVIILLFTLALEKNRKETLISIGVLALNIPIAFIYAHIVLNHII